MTNFRYLIFFVASIFAMLPFVAIHADIIFPQDRDRMIITQCDPVLEDCSATVGVSSHRLRPDFPGGRGGTPLRTDIEDFEQPYILADCDSASVVLVQTGFRNWPTGTNCQGAGQADFKVYNNGKLTVQFSSLCHGFNIQKTHNRLQIIMSGYGFDYLHLTDEQIKVRDFAPFTYDPDNGWVQGARGENV
ncbi:hypothetical protein [Parasulfitobacter algicola]|uniref:Uncharacterized protein n=1 Tax=Parasulfitobacter algicola TaxID=2614809 RepID=A0ABX2ISJ2_9RHOB|nr:hypothetical protein [Sulfitobacter algicola]NSX55878.1 hypothetical protein [Sulfitobacter algicola]